MDPSAGDRNVAELPMSTRIAVIGAGSWGTTVGAIAAVNADAVLWARDRAVADEINADHQNVHYLPDIGLPESLRATSDLIEACTGADVIVLGVPSHGMREVLETAASAIGPDVPVLSLSKGVEQGTSLRMTEVIADVLRGLARIASAC